MTRTQTPTATLERYAFYLLAAGLGIIQLSIFGYAPLAIAGVLWGIILVRERRAPDIPPFFVALMVLAAWTLISSAFSLDPAESFKRSRQLFYYLIVPLTLRVARGPRAMAAVNLIIAVGAASALWGLGQYLYWGFAPDHRPHGLLGHYMTYSGILMLVICVAVARLVFRGREWVWPAVAVPSLLMALATTESRNAYLGVLVAIALLLALRNWKLLIAVPVLVGVFAVAAPTQIRDRALSTFDSTNATNRDRISMLKSGLAMIEDHPIFGVGLNMVPAAYLASYKRADAMDPADEPGAGRSHLHNVPVQLAAERGLPAAAAWLWFVIVAARDLWRRAIIRGPSQALAAGGLAALAAAVVAGMFEHNFGDSEFLVLFLGLISLPFAAERPQDHV